VSHEIGLRQPKGVVWIILRAVREWRGIETRRTCPADYFVAPERGGVVEMLHQRVVPPETHAVDHPPLVFAFIVRVIIRILKDVGGVVCERVGVATGAILWSSGTTGGGAEGRGGENGAIWIEGEGVWI
jgi:hypothetical protein